MCSSRRQRPKAWYDRKMQVGPTGWPGGSNRVWAMSTWTLADLVTDRHYPSGPLFPWGIFSLFALSLSGAWTDVRSVIFSEGNWKMEMGLY